VLEEPSAVVPHARICEGGGPDYIMENLNGHEAGNGGYSQGEPVDVVRPPLLGGPIRINGSEILAFDNSHQCTMVYSTNGTFLRQYHDPRSSIRVSELLPIGSDRLLIKRFRIDRTDRINNPQWEILTIMSTEGDTINQIVGERYSFGREILIGNRGTLAPHIFNPRSSVNYYEGYGILRYTNSEPFLQWLDIDGSLHRSIHLKLTPEPVTEEENAGIQRYLQRMLSDNNPISQELYQEALRQSVIPAVKTYWASVHVDEYGYHWIRKHPDYTKDSPSEDFPRFSLISPEGEYLGEVTFPELQSWVSRGKVLAYRQDEKTGEIVYVVYSMNPAHPSFLYPPE